MSNILVTRRHAGSRLCLPTRSTSSKSCPSANKIKAEHGPLQVKEQEDSILGWVRGVSRVDSFLVGGASP